MSQALKNIKTYLEEKNRRKQIISCAPGRADFLNTHQDYKGLPVIPIAINLYTYIGVIRESDQFTVTSLTLSRERTDYVDTFPCNNPPLDNRNKWFGNYLRSVIKALNKYKSIKLEKGLEIVIDSDIPLGSGLASSAALEVSFTTLLNYWFCLGLNKKEIAEISFLAENTIMRIPCGRLDQYSSAIGGAILINPNPPVQVEKLPLENIHLVIVDSGIRHSVSEIHPIRQREINIGLQELLNLDLPSNIKEKIGNHYYDTKWREIKIEQIEKYLDKINSISQKRIMFTFLMQEYTDIAIKIIRNEKLTSKEFQKIGYHKDKLTMLGIIMNKQHELLRDYYDVSLPEIEKIRNAMLNAGALGVKISGAGMGGSLIALIRKKKDANKIIEKAIENGASQGWYIKISEGPKIIS
ncbi:MAG: GHMP kinase [Thermoproteales archaeon]|nr:GHMP kinase [Thermoproteales archaeon]